MADSATGGQGPAGTSETNRPSATETATDDRAVRVGVLSPHNSKETKAILNAVRALGHEPVWLRDENVRSRIEDGTVQFVPEVDVLVNRVLVTKSDQPLEDLQFAGLLAEQVPVINPPDAVRTAIHKYSAAARLATAGLPVPDAVFGRDRTALDGWDDHLGGRATHKRTIGTNGQDMAVVTPDETVPPRIADGQSFLQEYVESEGERPSDVRVYVVGDRVLGGMRRRAPDGEWRTNVALGASVEDVSESLGPEPRRIATESAAVLGLDVAGVDLMRADDGWRILEVNATAGFKGFFEATGRSPAPYVAALAIDRAGGSTPDGRMAELDATLDDSVPDCKPSRSGVGEGDSVLGYTNRVEVTGTDGAVSTLAKADTGAARTSVDAALAGEVGAGPMVGTTDVRSTGHRTTETRPLVEVDLRVGGDWHAVTASVAERSDMRYDVLLGRDVLEAYTLDISQRVEE